MTDHDSASPATIYNRLSYLSQAENLSCTLLKKAQMLSSVPLFLVARPT
jgi:hypothetical protein